MTTSAHTSKRPQILPAWSWVAAGVVLAFALAAMTTAETVTITVPLAVQLMAAATLIWTVWRRRRGLVPWFEIGVVYASIVTLYGIYPLVKFVVVGEHYDAPALDTRWTALDPTVGEVAHIAWIYAFHLAAFGVAYLFVRGRLPLTVPRMRPPSTPVLMAAVVIYLIIQGFWFFLGLFYDTSAGTYIETYLVGRRLPLLLAQLLNHLNGAKYPLSLVILVGLFAGYPTARRVIAGWIVVMAILTLTRLGSRTEFALLVMAAAMAYHTLVRPVSPRAIVTGVAAAVTVFLTYGLLRSGWLRADTVSLNPFLYASEFDVLFLNAVELARATANGTLGVVPPALYFVDLAALIPQQIAPFQKVEAAAWYVTTFYPAYAAQGGGFAFGTMAEAVLTGGLLSAAARGAVLGFCFAKIHRFYARRADSYWVLVFYLWATTLSYQAFRGTTFLLLVMFVYRFLPVMIAVKLIAAAFKKAAHRTRLWSPSFTA